MLFEYSQSPIQELMSPRDLSGVVIGVTTFSSTPLVTIVLLSLLIPCCLFSNVVMIRGSSLMMRW